jgi:WD40 repeat protein
LLNQQRSNVVRVVANETSIDVRSVDGEGNTISRQQVVAPEPGRYSFVVRNGEDQNLDTGVVLKYDAGSTQKAGFGEVPSMQLVNDGEDLLIGGGVFDEAGRLRLFHLKAGTFGELDLKFSNKVTSVAAHQNTIAWVVKSDEGARLYCGMLSELSAETPIFDHLDSVARVAFSGDGSRMAVATENGTLRVWDVTRPAEPQQLMNQTLVGSEDPPSNYCLAFSADGQSLIVGTGQWKPWGRPVNEGKLFVVDINTKKTSRVIDAHDAPILSIAVSTSGETVATGGADGAVKLWDLSSGDCLQVVDADENGINGHSNVVQCIRYSPDGNFLASGSWDNTIRVWKADTLEQVAQLKQHEFFVQAVGFSADGKTLMSSGADDSVRFWEFKVLEGA